MIRMIKKMCGEAACRFAAIKSIMRIVRILFIMFPFKVESGE